MEIVKLLSEIKEVFAFLIAATGAIWAAYKHFDLKIREERRYEYKAYHELISSFTEGSALEKQIVILYELRNYPRYFEITRELLTHLLDRMENENVDSQLINQAK